MLAAHQLFCMNDRGVCRGTARLCMCAHVCTSCPGDTGTTCTLMDPSHEMCHFKALLNVLHDHKKCTVKKICNFFHVSLSLFSLAATQEQTEFIRSLTSAKE